MSLSPIIKKKRIMIPYTSEEIQLATNIANRISDLTLQRAEWRLLTKDKIGTPNFPKKRETQHLNQIFKRVTNSQ